MTLQLAKPPQLVWGCHLVVLTKFCTATLIQSGASLWLTICTGTTRRSRQVIAPPTTYVSVTKEQTAAAAALLGNIVTHLHLLFAKTVVSANIVNWELPLVPDVLLDNTKTKKVNPAAKSVVQDNTKTQDNRAAKSVWQGTTKAKRDNRAVKFVIPANTRIFQGQSNATRVNLACIRIRHLPSV